MKTSQKEGVSDRPPNACDLPRHEATQLNGGRLVPVRRSWTPFKPVRILALLPFRSPPDAGAITPMPARSTANGVTNGFLSHRPPSVRWLTTWTFSELSPRKGCPRARCALGRRLDDDHTRTWVHVGAVRMSATALAPTSSEARPQVTADRWRPGCVMTSAPAQSALDAGVAVPVEVVLLGEAARVTWDDLPPEHADVAERLRDCSALARSWRSSRPRSPSTHARTSPRPRRRNPSPMRQRPRHCLIASIPPAVERRAGRDRTGRDDEGGYRTGAVRWAWCQRRVDAPAYCCGRQQP
jgi:hypothetical protein